MSVHTPRTPWLPRLDGVPKGSTYMFAAVLVHTTVLLGTSLVSPTTRVPGFAAPDLPGLLNFWWTVVEQGVGGAAHSRTIMFPGVTDRLTIQGVPVEAAIVAPLYALFGWALGTAAAFWLWVAALGLGVAWFAARWSRSALGGFAAAVVVQTSGSMLQELAEGRVTHLLATALVPVALGCALDATDRANWRSAVAAGVTAGLASLLYWYWGAFLLGMFGVLGVLGLLDGRALLAPMARIGLAGALTVLAPMSYTLMHVGSHAGIDVKLYDAVDGGMRLIDLLEHRDLGRLQETAGPLLRPVGMALAVAALLGPRRQITAPLAWGLGGAALALGPIIALRDFDLLGPFAAVTAMPVMRRLWWPDRLVFVAILGLGLLCALGVSRLRGAWRVLVLGVLIEPWLLAKHLPMPFVDFEDPKRQQTLAAFRDGQGPLLVLPMLLNTGMVDLEFYLLQPLYERPTVNGNINPDSVLAPLPYRAIFEAEPLRSLYACELAPEKVVPLESAPLADLRTMGVNDIYVDIERSEALNPAHLQCLQTLLGPGESDGPFLRYRLRL